MLYAVVATDQRNSCTLLDRTEPLGKSLLEDGGYVYRAQRVILALLAGKEEPWVKEYLGDFDECPEAILALLAAHDSFPQWAEKAWLRARERFNRQVSGLLCLFFAYYWAHVHALPEQPTSLFDIPQSYHLEMGGEDEMEVERNDLGPSIEASRHAETTEERGGHCDNDDDDEYEKLCKWLEQGN